MARKNANSSPGVWLGLLLVLVAHTLALSTLDEGKPESGESPQYDDNWKIAPPGDQQFVDPIAELSKNVHEVGEDEARISLHSEKQMDKLNDVRKSADSIESNSSEKSNGNDESKAVKISPEPIATSASISSRTIPTETTTPYEKDRVINSSSLQDYQSSNTIIEKRQNETLEASEVKPSTTSHQELEFAEEQVDFEDHTSSALAEGTTPSSNSSNVDHQITAKDLNKNIEVSDLERPDYHWAGGSNVTISLANDTNVNYYVKNSTRDFPGNVTSTLINDIGVSSSHELEHGVEVFNVTSHPSNLKISDETEREPVIDNTTPYYSISKPKGRTISITGDNDLSQKMPKDINNTNVHQTVSDTIMRIVPKKSVSTEKPTELKPYPYLKSETKFADHDEIITEKSNRSDETTEEISAFENTIGRKGTDEKIIVTEASVLVENSIQQFKPIHNKRSGNSSRVNSTFENPVASTAWSLATTEDLVSKNGTLPTEESLTTVVDIGNRSQINNDVPQDNPNNSITTERSQVVLSEVTENNIGTIGGEINGTLNLTASTPITKQLTEHTDIANGRVTEDTLTTSGSQAVTSTEKIPTVLNGSSTSNEIQTGIDYSKMTVSQFNATGETTESTSLPENVTISTNVANATEKLNSELQTSASSPESFFTTTESVLESSGDTSAFQFSETKIIEGNVTSFMGKETIPENHGSTRSITESNVGQTTTVQYEFVALTTIPENFTISPDDVKNTEINDTTTDSTNDSSQTTLANETVITDDPMEENQTISTENVETVTTASESSTTPSFETMTTLNGNSEVTTVEDTTNTTDTPVNESSLNTVTDIYKDTTFSLSTRNASHARVDEVTIGQVNGSEETTTTVTTETVPLTEQPTTITNIEIIVSSENTVHTTTVAESTSPKIQSTSELPEFPILNADVTLFVSVVIEGSWSEVCPLMSNLRLSLANLLTEGTTRTVYPRNIILHQTQCSVEQNSDATVAILLYVVDDNGDFDYAMTEMLPSLYKQSAFSFPLTIHSVKKVEQPAVNEPSNNAIAVVAVSSVAFICLVLLAGLLFIMRKRQTRFNYGERCRPVSLDAFRVDSVSAYNSVRRKDLTRASKRSYGNPAFEDSSVTPSHPLNFAGLSSFCNDTNAITEEFAGIPQVNARMDELPAGSEVKNRYANVAPLPETRVLLQKINNEPLTEYINASYVRGPKNATKYYIACQAPMESTVSDFWRMIWEQQSKVIIMLTDIVENGVEKCVEYIPPSEVTDCHRLYGDYQVTLKKREAKEKYAISTLHLKNLENNTYREVSHIWYLWPTNGVPSNATGLIAILLEARALQRGAPGPIVIHCSPGTGRTGTLIALDLGIRQYEITRTIDVPRVVYTIRRDRAGAVQTKEQYAFIYKALNLYAAKLAGGALESM